MQNAAVFPSSGQIQQPQAALGFSKTVTSSAAGILTTDVPCVGVEVQSSSKDDSNASMTGVMYIEVGGVKIYELTTGQTAFIPCSNTSQIKIVTQTGTAWARGIIHQQRTF